MMMMMIKNDNYNSQTLITWRQKVLFIALTIIIHHMDCKSNRYCFTFAYTTLNMVDHTYSWTNGKHPTGLYEWMVQRQLNWTEQFLDVVVVDDDDDRVKDVENNPRTHIGTLDPNGSTSHGNHDHQLWMLAGWMAPSCIGNNFGLLRIVIQEKVHETLAPNQRKFKVVQVESMW